MCSTGRDGKKQEDQNSNLRKSIWLEVIVTRKSNPVEHFISTLVGEFSCMRRRQRQPDSLASSAAIRGVLSELKECCPSLSTLPDREFHKLLQSIRHLETYSATDTKRGRPTIFARELLDDAGSHLKAILFRNSGDRISIQTFIGHYLPILGWPEDVVRALERGDLSRCRSADNSMKFFTIFSEVLIVARSFSAGDLARH
jgi:hypothetical protein